MNLASLDPADGSVIAESDVMTASDVKPVVQSARSAYPALTADNASVVTDGIQSVTERGIVTSDGTEHEVDCIIFGTGFKMADHPGFDVIHGRDGTSLAEQWRTGEMSAYLGTAVHNFPNMFLILGLNSGVYTSAVITIEDQVHYIREVIRTMDRKLIRTLEVRQEVEDSFATWADRGLRHSVFVNGRCDSYYLSPSGRNFTHYPGYSAGFRAKTRSVRLTDYVAESGVSRKQGG